MNTVYVLIVPHEAKSSASEIDHILRNHYKNKEIICRHLMSEEQWKKDFCGGNTLPPEAEKYIQLIQDKGKEIKTPY